MEDIGSLLNGFLVNNFNNILRWEERVLSGAFEGRLSVSEYHVIEAVILAAETGENTMGEVARRLGITVGTLTTAVKTLSRKGFILREKGSCDRRTVWLFPTPEAEAANRFHSDFHKRMVGGIMDCLDHNQLLTLATALGVLGDWFNSVESEQNYIEVTEDIALLSDDPDEKE
ncbi:MAG: MarR family transcriptional regulator [Angelakisella sp.]